VNERERGNGYSPLIRPPDLWGENLGAPQGLLSPNVEPAPDLSRTVEMASPSILANSTLGSNNVLGEATRNGTAQIRRGKIRHQTGPSARRDSRPTGSGVRSPARRFAHSHYRCIAPRSRSFTAFALAPARFSGQ
jgi:hypothetical protein